MSYSLLNQGCYKKKKKTNRNTFLPTFQDRFAFDRLRPPPVDPSQDWFLVSGEEENGYTVLEFTRNLTSCDVNDLNIEVYVLSVSL